MSLAQMEMTISASSLSSHSIRILLSGAKPGSTWKRDGRRKACPELQVELVSKLGDALLDMGGLGLQVFAVVKAELFHLPAPLRVLFCFIQFILPSRRGIVKPYPPLREPPAPW